jgi:hypothetical protein
MLNKVECDFNKLNLYFIELFKESLNLFFILINLYFLHNNIIKHQTSILKFLFHFSDQQKDKTDCWKIIQVIYKILVRGYHLTIKQIRILFPQLINESDIYLFFKISNTL